MLMKFKIHMAGHRHVWEKGEEYDLKDIKECARLARAGYATPVEEADAKTLAPLIAQIEQAESKAEQATASRPRSESRSKARK